MEQARRERRERLEALVATTSTGLKEAVEGDPRVARNRRLVELAVAAHGQALCFADASLRADRFVVASAVENEGRSLQFAAPELRGDEEVCLAAVTNDGRALRYCSTAARDDPRICRAACATYGLALQYASRRCRNDEDVVYVRLRLKLTLPFATSLLKPLTRRSRRSDLAQQQGAPRCSSTVSHSPTRPEPSVATSRRCS